MVGTATSGAQNPQLVDTLPSSAAPVSYFHGDIASHRFNVPRRDVAAAQPSASNVECGFCHAAFLNNP